ncbi:MAG: aminoglycoside phosphotransferase (APT) family kinase protein [Halioglobus sp.]
MSEPITGNEMRDRLCGWLQEKLPNAQQVEISEFTSPEAGASNETLLFTATWLEDGEPKERGLVARLKPVAEGIFPSYNLGLQYHAMDALAGSGIPVPVMVALEEDEALLGRPFYVMERVPGRYLADNPPYHMDGWLTECSPQERGAIWRNAVSEIARVGSVNWEDRGFGEICSYAPYANPLEAQMAEYEAFLLWAEEENRPYPKLHACLAWLKKNQPTDQPISLCWGDAKASNLMMDGTDICATLDWEMVHLGNPVHDLAWWLVLDGSFTEGLSMEPLEGIPSREELIAQWQEQSGRSTADLGYYEFFAVFQFGVIMARVGTLLTAKGIFQPEDEFDINNTCTPLLDRWMATHNISV